MSRASKIFLASSFVVSGITVWGVHYIQKRESDTMYQGVLKDEARIAAKAASSAAAALLKPITPSALTSPPSGEVANTSHSSGTPLNTPSSPVQQPAPVIDEECTTCVISPPPQLLESQSREERARERELRMREYVEQKSLDSRLRGEQGVSEQPSGTRLV
ncbi:hypothetical protein I302_105437 [Kwoniella bestiolae CBS 10118]|uniref:Uncharacterized protein n=1 Tax=Kwoniella bestiolae CBS 10118 TaxID=1296100 RepID=A0A1B9FT46_9TREE|nr:hypothetical protein I302_08718 [Kwoniella bestiolae CBS 10118]OCF21938.1 hypothetical protein I302_08718 [Kwoniella bestiolae CBS 10118]